MKMIEINEEALNLLEEAAAADNDVWSYSEVIIGMNNIIESHVAAVSITKELFPDSYKIVVEKYKETILTCVENFRFEEAKTPKQSNTKEISDIAHNELKETQ